MFKMVYQRSIFGVESALIKTNCFPAQVQQYDLESVLALPGLGATELKE